MTRNDTDPTMICTSDFAGQMRGKAVPLARLRRGASVGWTPTNAMLTAFGPIAPSPWGPRGDLVLRPDPEAHTDLCLPDWGVDLNFALGDILELDGSPWQGCLRGHLRRALDRLRRDHGLALIAAFEHEFTLENGQAQAGLGYGLRAFRRMGDFPNRLMATLDQAGLAIDTFMPEYGPGQCEITIGPKPGLRAADEAATLRDITRAVAAGMGQRASFAPIVDPKGVGNGVHVHFSLTDMSDVPVNYDATAPHSIAPKVAGFLAGICEHMPDFLAFTASGVPSYLRLTPNRWSAAYNNLGVQDREAALRVCPVFGQDGIEQKFHFEFRGADGTATPHLVLAALIHAGCDGLDRRLACPQPTEIRSDHPLEPQMRAAGYGRLPMTLDSALDALEASDWARASFGDLLVNSFVAHKRFEADMFKDLQDDEICALYCRAY